MNTKKIIFVGTLLIVGILMAHFSSYSTNPSQGFDVLLYEPFDFAFSVLVVFIFLYINKTYMGVMVINENYTEVLLTLLYALMFSVVWTVVAFLALVQFHLSLGGQL